MLVHLKLTMVASTQSTPSTQCIQSCNEGKGKVAKKKHGNMRMHAHTNVQHGALGCLCALCSTL